MSALSIVTIPPQQDFIALLAQGLQRESAQRGIPLADFLVLLPTRRAARALTAQFAATAPALLLPRLLPLGEADEAELFFAAAGQGVPLPEIPPAIAPFERQLRLAQLVLRHHRLPLRVDGAWQLAGALASLLDAMQLNNTAPAALGAIVPDELAAHWQAILGFLQEILTAWAQELARLGRVDPVQRRNQLLARQAALWQQHPPATPIIAAGSTASVPATAQLLRVIAGLPHGMVILPGLDHTLPETVWEQLDKEPTHPQYMLRQWLAACDVPRRAVRVWPEPATASPRVALLQEAMLPAMATAQWRDHPPASALPEHLSGLQLCVAESTAEEAQTIALKLRSVLAVPERTAMLVTRDRQLAQRVVVALQRWGITIDDSAGQPLATTPAGRLLQLVLAAAQPQATPTALMGLLKHPLVALGFAPVVCRATARLAEQRLWRGQRQRVSGLPMALALVATLPREEREMVSLLLTRLQTALAPLQTLLTAPQVALRALITAQLAAAEALAATAEEAGAMRLWRGEDGAALAAVLEEALTAVHDMTLAAGGDYPDLCRSWLTAAVVRPIQARHPRLTILGPLEARLQQADCVILAGLNEGSWPGTAMPDPWLSRPMRAESGLPAPEHAIGQAAHDFVQLAARGDVLLTRARKAEGKPTAPSRFLLRLQTLLAARGYAPEALQPPEPWTVWAHVLDAAATTQSMEHPMPRPALARRPQRFNVTAIETWRRNPYGFYAAQVLRLSPLPPLAREWGSGDFGTLVHKVLEEFIAATRETWPQPEAALADLLARGAAALAPYQSDTLLHQTWMHQFAALAPWFVTTETARRATATPVALECQAILPLQVGGRDYQLVGRADRIDMTAEGVVIIDYKTRHVPSEAQVKAGIAPQLPLLGAMVAAGCFAGVNAQPVAELIYYKLSGRQDKDEVKALKEGAALVAPALAQLQETILAYADPAMPYLVTPQPEFVPYHDEYRHLGRMAEWGLEPEREEAP